MLQDAGDVRELMVATSRIAVVIGRSMRMPDHMALMPVGAYFTPLVRFLVSDGETHDAYVWPEHKARLLSLGTVIERALKAPSDPAAQGELRSMMSYMTSIISTFEFLSSLDFTPEIKGIIQLRYESARSIKEALEARSIAQIRNEIERMHNSG